MNKIQEQIISHVQMDIEPGEVVTEELLTELVRFIAADILCPKANSRR